MQTPTTAGLLDILGSMHSSLGSETFDLGSVTIGLAKAPFTPSKTLLMSDITEANFPGYVRKAIGTLTPAFYGPLGLLVTQGGELNWSGSDTTTTNQIYGAFIVGSADTITVKFSELFNTPIPITGPTSRLTYVPRIGFDPAASFGLSLVSN